LHEQVHRGTYRALASRRRYIAKPDGRQRPLGIAALEDKIVQRAVVQVLNAIYEEDSSCKASDRRCICATVGPKAVAKPRQSRDADDWLFQQDAECACS